MKKNNNNKEKEKSSYVRCIDAAEGYRARLPGTSFYRKDTQRLNSGVSVSPGTYVLWRRPRPTTLTLISQASRRGEP